MNPDTSTATATVRSPKGDDTDQILSAMLEEIQHQALRAPKPKGRPS